MKSIEILFNEALAALDEVGKRSKFDTKLKTLKEKMSGKTPPLEVQLNCAEEVLKESRVIRKYNGAADNGHEEFRESGGSSYITEKSDPFAATDKHIFDFMESRGEITAEQKRVLTGEKPSEYSNLTEGQKKDFDFARLIGLSESDAFKVVKITHR